MSPRITGVALRFKLHYRKLNYTVVNYRKLLPRISNNNSEKHATKKRCVYEFSSRVAKLLRNSCEIFSS